MPLSDAHHHVWWLGIAPYLWMAGTTWDSIRRDFEFKELRDDMVLCGISKTILVQADNTLEDCEHVRSVATSEAAVAGFVGWVPLTDAAAVGDALDRLTDSGKFLGVRHVLGFEADDNWVLRPDVVQGLRALQQRRLVFEVNCDRPAFLRHVPTLAKLLPDLTMVVNHIGKPPIGAQGWEPWASDLARAAACPNVYAKLSGLTTPVRPGWSGEDFRPYINHAVDVFGPRRLMYASNWPVTLVAGSYVQQWEALRIALDTLSDDERAEVYGKAAARCYRLDL